jgi:hypothetical protein
MNLEGRMHREGVVKVTAVRRTRGTNALFQTERELS